MKALTGCLMIALAVGVTGCPDRMDRPWNTMQKGGLEVRLQLAERHYLVGDQVKVTVEARNTGGEPIRIPADTGARVLVKVYQHTGTGWEQVKRYPQAATMVMSPWTLEPGAAAGPFELVVPVEPDWPTNEILRLTAELNGRPDVAPGVAITITRVAESEE